MKRSEIYYHIRRLPTTVIVVASDPSTMEVCLVPHLIHHSPTGMEFGYNGSGPADLALSLLTFHLEAHAPDVKELVAGWKNAGSVGQVTIRVVRLYQLFKDEVLAVTSLDFLDLSGKMLDHWITLRERQAADRATIEEKP